MKNNKGFTLVELIGVIVIMGLLIAVVSTPIIGEIRNQRDKLNDATEKVLYASVETYLDDNVSLYPKKEGMKYYVSISLLTDTGYLKSNFVESSKDVITSDSYIEVTVNKGVYNYQIDKTHTTTLDSIYNNISSSASTYSYMNGLYFKGTALNNYVYYSGFTWRIMGKNYDGSIRLVSDEVLTNLQFGSKGTKSFKTSYANEWLNNYFISRLANNDIIVKLAWCESSSSSKTKTDDSCVDSDVSKLLNAKVGLLSLEEYNLSIDSVSNATYLNNNDKYITLTKDTTNTNFYYISPTIGYSSSNGIYGIRPVINVRKEALAITGDGSVSNPYVLMQDLSIDKSSKALSDINLVPGEYISMVKSSNNTTGNTVYRVVDVDNNNVKLISIDTYETTSFATTNTYSLEDGVGKTVNEIKICGYSKYQKTTTWYQGDYGDNSYKYTSLAKTNYVNGIKIGIPKLGELLTVGNVTNSFWTMSKADDTKVYAINKISVEAADPTSEYAYKLVPIISTDAIIKSGKGTKASPYVLKEDSSEEC